MNLKECLPEKSAKLIVGIFFMIGAIGFLVTGFTFLPIVGFILAIPFVAASIYFFRVHLDEKCQIS